MPKTEGEKQSRKIQHKLISVDSKSGKKSSNKSRCRRSDNDGDDVSKTTKKQEGVGGVTTSRTATATETEQPRLWTSWETMYERLVEYKDEHGDTMVPKSIDKYRHLSSWCTRQRLAYSRGQLSDNKIEKLNDLEFVWKTHTPRTWDHMLDKLVEYKELYGNCLVPHRHVDDQNLANWVNNQRTRKKTGDMTEEQIEKLTNVGFVFEVRKVHSFDEMFSRLLEYKEQHGNLLVPQRYPENQKLANWVNKLRTKSQKGIITDEEREKLDAIGFVWKVRVVDSWDDMYGRLVEFKERHGNCVVPVRYDNDQKLSNWVDKQRSKRSNDDLEKTKIEKLDELGFVWTLKGNVWNVMYEKLKSYKEKYGDCLVPNGYPDGSSRLANWLSTQRSRKVRGILSDDQISKLEAVGFEWKGPKAGKITWDQMYDRLLLYKEKFGNVEVPADYNDDTQLSSWVHKQRIAYHTKNNDPFVSLSPDQLIKLTKVGFVWGDPPPPPPPPPNLEQHKSPSSSSSHKNPKQAKENEEASMDEVWKRMYGKLAEYRVRHGDCLVPANYGEDVELANWVVQQREEYNSIKMPRSKFAKLHAIGFDFNDPYLDESWVHMYEKLAAYRVENGNCLVPPNYEPDVELANWVIQQRRDYHLVEMSRTKMTKLQLIGFNFLIKANCSDEPRQWDINFKKLVAYKIKNDNTSVPPNYESDVELANWVIQQRANYANGSISYEHCRKLEAIGFDLQIPRGTANTADDAFHHQSNFESVEGTANRVVNDSRQDNTASCNGISSLPVAENYNDKSQCNSVVDHALAFAGNGQNNTNDPAFSHHGGMHRLQQNIRNLNQPCDPAVFVNTLQGGDQVSWNTMFNRLMRHKEKYGNCSAPNEYKDDKPLADWVRQQRVDYLNLKLSIDQVRKLGAIGFMFGPMEDTNAVTTNTNGAKSSNAPILQQQQQKRLVATHVSNTNDVLNAPPSHLATKQNSGDDVLASYALGPQTVEEKKAWDTMFNRLLMYKEVHGDCSVPNEYEGDKPLADWVRQQRFDYLNLNLSFDQVRNLGAIGFVLDPFENTHKNSARNNGSSNLVENWHNHNNNMNGDPALLQQQKQRNLNRQQAYQDSQLKLPMATTKHPFLSYDKDNGNCIGKSASGGPKRLYEQRSGHSKKDSHVGGQTRKHEFVQNLKERKGWEIMCNRLARYKAKYGNCLVPTYYKDDQPLANWVRIQRSNYSNLKHSIDQVSELGALGFHFEEEEATGNSAFSTMTNINTDRGVPPGQQHHCQEPWQNDRFDLPFRRGLLQDIADVLHEHRNDPSPEWLEKLPREAQKLEEELYQSASSLEQYTNRSTLRTRLGKIVKEEILKDVQAMAKMTPAGHQHVAAPPSKKAKKIAASMLPHHAKALATIASLTSSSSTSATSKHTKNAPMQTLLASEGWEIMYNRLARYKAMHGNCLVPMYYNDDQPLANWVRFQREDYANLKLSIDQVSKLGALGFDFELREGISTVPNINANGDVPPKQQYHCQESLQNDRFNMPYRRW